MSVETAFVNLLGDRIYASQYGSSTFGLVTHVAGVPGDADGPVSVTMETVAEVPVVIFTRDADNVDIGTYEITLSSVETQTPGLFRVMWSYEVATIPQIYSHVVEVGEASIAYDSLSDEMKAVVESGWMRFADLFDSPYGGPHLQVYFQTRFGRGRMAQLLSVAMGKLNTLAQPFGTYSVHGPPTGSLFPVAQWGPLLEQALYIEALKHLIRSYVEQPDDPGVNVARLDRRDYLNRWQQVLTIEQRDFDAQLDSFKIAHMGLGSTRVLVSGGAYGRYGPTMANPIPARPRYYQRFH